ncbi:MAG: hypothetical protein KAU35_10610 [candidate division Zixibacteria bacterium]|nr:hypothetical protein [candidate division Zixibacteria bacterium]
MRYAFPALIAVTLLFSGGTADTQYTQIDDCGYLQQGVEAGCVLFVTDHHGSYLIGDLGGFGIGDRVRVVGAVDPACITFCMQGDGCLIDYTISECGIQFHGCGRIVQGAECVLFLTDLGGLYLLDNYGGFTVGDRVCVSGILDPDCFSICMEEDACIVSVSIWASCCEERGDINHSGGVDIADLVYLVEYMFDRGPAPPCTEEADTNVDGAPIIDISDLVGLIRYMFGGTLLPPCN